MSDQSNEKIWHAIYNVPDDVIWDTRMGSKKKLTDYIRVKFRETWLKNQGDPARVVSLLEKINPNALMIGFCRRLRLIRELTCSLRILTAFKIKQSTIRHLVQFLFAGKGTPRRWCRPGTYQEDL